MLLPYEGQLKGRKGVLWKQIRLQGCFRGVSKGMPGRKNITERGVMKCIVRYERISPSLKKKVKLKNSVEK